ncbi:hypothetical protein J26TS2_01020 [Shouchella clausii]|nr:hypothetical protein J26TS2_01020 [Shouchella clausii]
MKKYATLASILTLSLTLAACGNESTAIKSDEEVKAKTGDSAETATTNEEDDEGEEAETEVDEEKEADIWTYYEDAQWETDFNGLKIKIEKVVVTEHAPTLQDESAEESAVGVKFNIENTSDKTWATFPDQATLVTSTGEQIDMPDMWISDSIGGEIHGGVIKEGDVIWYLERGEAESIEWIKLVFSSSDPDNFTVREEFEVELDLK